jgi:hypothetical protein
VGTPTQLDSYTGSSLVAGGRVTQQVRISRRVFFG